MKKATLCHVCVFLILAVMLAVACTFPSAAKEAQDAGRISAVQGEAKLQREGTPAGDVKVFDTVRINDSIRIGQNSMVKIIFYSDYHEEMIKGKSLARLSRKSAGLVEGPKDCISITRKPPVSTLPDNPSHNGRSIAAAVIKGETLLPRGAFKKVSDTPVFSWDTINGAGYYRVIISILNDENNVELVNTVIKNNSYTVPAEKKLAFGTRYALQVVACENDPADPTYQGMEDNIIASNQDTPYYFILPLKENLAFIDEMEKSLTTLKKGSPEWNSSASLLLIACMEFGLVDKAGALAKEMMSTGFDHEDISRIAFKYGSRSQKK